MWGRDTVERAFFEALLAVFLLLDSSSVTAQAGDSGGEPPISVLGRLDTALVKAVNEVVPRAADKLRNAKCQLVLTDFRDGNGKTLRENLAARARSDCASSEIGLDRAVAYARDLAVSKLSLWSCRLLFTDFHDRDGNDLQQRLDARGLTPVMHFQKIRFLNGDGSAYCRRKDLLAFTTPGSPVVFLCGDRFRKRALRWPTYAANLLIHEALHSLGLEENPPSSEEITLNVVDRCGR